ncbi:hypothetical protein CLD22_11295 [Rubrivivax gelatinosus]|nr:hypothetical protein [Rubrivivax gelatinosus]
MNDNTNNESCPRCGGAFHCGAAGPGPCACSQFKLEPRQLRAMMSLYPRCLCPDCLRAIAAGASLQPAPAA